MQGDEASLECDLCPELDDPRAGGIGYTKAGRTHHVAGKAVVRVVEEVQEVTTHLQIHFVMPD